MKVAILTEKYGEIVYEENIWTGSKKLLINGVYLTKLNKKTFVGNVNGENITVLIKGGYITGVTIDINGTFFRVTEAAKWYDYIFAFIWVPIYLTLSVMPSFYMTVPILGGAIGGAIVGIGAALTLYTIKPMKNIAAKFGVAIGIFALVMVINIVGAFAFLSVVL